VQIQPTTQADAFIGRSMCAFALDPALPSRHLTQLSPTTNQQSTLCRFGVVEWMYEQEEYIYYMQTGWRLWDLIKVFYALHYVMYPDVPVTYEIMKAMYSRCRHFFTRGHATVQLAVPGKIPPGGMLIPVTGLEIVLVDLAEEDEE
jgi:hypothetical protein